jgi:hypothetical protein
MIQLLDPKHSIAIILGAHDWTKAGRGVAPSFRRSAAHFHSWLQRRPPHGLGLEPDLILYLFDDPSPASSQLERIRNTVRSLIGERSAHGEPIRDLLIYYIGHGTCEFGRQLHMLVRDTVEGLEEQSSIGAPALAQVLRVAAPHQRRLVILDCCFSEAAVEAFGAMGALDEVVAAVAVRNLAPQSAPPERGIVLLCSSSRDLASIGRPNADRTLFTGAMLSILNDGVPWRRNDMLSFADLREEIYDRMLRDNLEKDPPHPALHQPDQQYGDLTKLPAFPNAASSGQSNAFELETRWRNAVIGACKKFDNISTGRDIPKEALFDACSAFSLDSSDELIAFISYVHGDRSTDRSTIASLVAFTTCALSEEYDGIRVGRKGLAFSTKGLHWRNHFKTPSFLPWSELGACRFHYTGWGALRLNDKLKISRPLSLLPAHLIILLTLLQTHPDLPK